MAKLPSRSVYFMLYCNPNFYVHSGLYVLFFSVSFIDYSNCISQALIVYNVLLNILCLQCNCIIYLKFKINVCV